MECISCLIKASLSKPVFILSNWNKKLKENWDNFQFSNDRTVTYITMKYTCNFNSIKIIRFWKQLPISLIRQVEDCSLAFGYVLEFFHTFHSAFPCNRKMKNKWKYFYYNIFESTFNFWHKLLLHKHKTHIFRYFRF